MANPVSMPSPLFFRNISIAYCLKTAGCNVGITGEAQGTSTR